MYTLVHMSYHRRRVPGKLCILIYVRDGRSNVFYCLLRIAAEYCYTTIDFNFHWQLLTANELIECMSVGTITISTTLIVSDYMHGCFIGCTTATSYVYSPLLLVEG